MALNDLLHRHQVSLVRSHSATSDAARKAHDGQTAHYARRIRTMRADAGAAIVEPLRVT